MHTFFKLIRTLKELKLNKDEWALLANIYSALPNKNWDAFENSLIENLLQNKIKFENETVESILDFVRAWFLLINDLIHLSSLIHIAIKDKIQQNIILSNDDWAGIVIPLLPPPSELIQITIQKIEWLSKLCLSDIEISALLRRFMYTITQHFHHGQTLYIPTLQLTINEEQRETITQEVYNCLLIKKLNQYCSIYCNYLANYFGSYIKDNDEQAYLYYTEFIHKNNFHSWIKDELFYIHLTDETHVANPNDTITTLLTKYKKITKLIEVLTDKASTTENKLMSFCDYFNEKFSKLNKKTPEPGFSLFKTYHYIRNELEIEFIQACSAIVSSYSNTNTSAQDNHQARI